MTNKQAPCDLLPLCLCINWHVRHLVCALTCMCILLRVHPLAFVSCVLELVQAMHHLFMLQYHALYSC